MDRLNHLNIKQEEHDGQKKISINNAQQQQNNQGHDASSCQLSVRAPKHVKKEEEGEDGIVKQVQPCTKVKKEEEVGECIKFEWDGDECDCEECRVDRQTKVEFNQNNATNHQVHQDNSSQGNSDTKKGVPSQISVCKRVKKEEEEEGDDQWDEDCDCDDCRRMRLKAIRLKQTSANQQSRTENREVGGDDGEETEIDEDGDCNEDFLVGNVENMAVDDQIGDKDGDAFYQEGEQSGDGQESSEHQMSDADNETEIDDEEYEMEVAGEDEGTEQFGNQIPIHDDHQPNGQVVEIEEENGDEETEIEDNEGDYEIESRTVKDSRIETTPPNPKGQAQKIVKQPARHLKRKQTDQDQEIATECTTNPIQPILPPPNRHLQCSHCPKSFERKHDFTRHLRVHTGERPFHCDQCDKRFGERSKLTQHQMIHQNIKRFRCPECDKQFTHKHSLDSHLRTHSGERPFECRHCDLSFTHLSHRNKHEQAIHLHVKPYRCKQCAHTATHRSNVIRHIRIVHFGLPKSIKKQRVLNIVDGRDPRELVEKV